MNTSRPTPWRAALHAIQIRSGRVDHRVDRPGSRLARNTATIQRADPSSLLLDP
jgi:hypothetical protein